MPLTGNPEHDIPVERAAGKPEKQAVAIALSKEREMKGKDAAKPSKVHVDVPKGKVNLYENGSGTKFQIRQRGEVLWEGTDRTLAMKKLKGLREEFETAEDVEPVPVSTKYAERPPKPKFSGNSLVMTAEQAKEAYAPKGQGPGRLHDADPATCEHTSTYGDGTCRYCGANVYNATAPVPVKKKGKDDYEEEGWDLPHHPCRPVQEHEDIGDAEVKPVRVNPAPMVKTVPVSKAKHVKDNQADVDEYYKEFKEVLQEDMKKNPKAGPQTLAARHGTSEAEIRKVLAWRGPGHYREASDNQTGEASVINKVQAELMKVGLPWNPVTKTVVEEACRNGMPLFEIVDNLKKFHRGHAEDAITLSKKEAAVLLRVLKQ